MVSSAMALEELTEGVYADTTGENGGNVGAIVLPGEIVAVDAGTAHTLTRTNRKFIEERTGLTVRKVIYTHSHSDHVFGAQAYPDAMVFGSAKMNSRCEDNLKGQWQLDALRKAYESVKDERPVLWEALQDLTIRLPDVTFEDEIVLGEEDEVTVRWTGGHTSGSAIVIARSQRVVFVGDLIFQGQFPYAGDPTCNPDTWIEALQSIVKESYEFVVPGHGNVCSVKDVVDYGANLRALRDSVKRGIADGIAQEDFIELGMYPEAWSAGLERWGEVSIKHWYSFYG